MQIDITVKELQERGLYYKLEKYGIMRSYALNEGLVSEDDTITLNEDEANLIGLIEKVEYN